MSNERLLLGQDAELIMMCQYGTAMNAHKQPFHLQLGEILAYRLARYIQTFAEFGNGYFLGG
jgi:hypothetical protein